MRVKASDKPGPFVREVDFQYETEGGEIGAATFRVRWEVENVVPVQPPKVYVLLREADGAGPLERHFVLSSIDGSDFRAVSAQGGAAWVDVLVASSHAVPQCTLMATINPVLIDVTGFATLEVVLDHPHQRRLSIAVTIRKFRTRPGDAGAPMAAAKPPGE